MNKFIGRLELPKDYLSLDRLVRLYGQKVVYVALAQAYGRNETLRSLSTILPEEVVDLQLSILVDNTTGKV